jgi:hypothetical protein
VLSGGAKKLPIQKGAVVLRALHSDELSVSGTPGNSLDELGLHIEDEYRYRYYPGLLRKSRTTQKAKFLSRAGREAEFLGAYLFSPPTEASVSEIIVLDDILTTGTTMKAIIQAIRSVLKDVEIKLFTLASTDQRAVLNKSVLLKGYSYEWVSNKGWITANEEVAEYHSLLTLLKQKILNDAFVDEDNER